MAELLDRTGQVNYNKQGLKMTIVNYKNKRNIQIKFESPYECIINTRYDAFKNGEIKNPLYPNVYDVGYIGIGKYNSGTGRGSKHNRCYELWSDMLYRCYKLDQKSYKDVIVCDEWHNFQNFAEWYHNNNWINENSDLVVTIDKDIFSLNDNKIYSPSTCCILDKSTNSMITDHNLKDINYIKYLKSSDEYVYRYDNITFKNKERDVVKSNVIEYKINKITKRLDYLNKNYGLPDNLYNNILEVLKERRNSYVL